MSDDQKAKRQPTASERFLAAIGKPVPPPMTEAQCAELEAAVKRAEAEADRIYGPVTEAQRARVEAAVKRAEAEADRSYGPERRDVT